ncbi:histidine phosphatase family protein [Fimbriimonas ginsengisoli]|nr:histidine phosphatase family protein [Fimbriimonas ginsengisoli]
MSGPVEIVLVRHGESVRNLSCDMAREGDPTELVRQMREEQEESSWPLTELGRKQAALAGEWLRKNIEGGYDASYVSPFLRTRETAEGLGLEGLKWEIDDRLREREWGEYSTEGYKPYTSQQYLTDLALCANLDWKTEYPGAESILDMVPRVEAFLTDAMLKTPQGRIIAVTHGGTIRAIQTVLEHLTRGERLPPDRRLSNCCVVMYRLSDIDLAHTEWIGEVRTAHPALPDAPETPWEPLGPK